MDLTEFLLARIAEDEAWQREHAHFHEAPEYVPPWWKRVDRECEAKRRIVERHRFKPIPKYDTRPQLDWCACLKDWPCPDLLDLASVYADHPDYDEDWRP